MTNMFSCDKCKQIIYKGSPVSAVYFGDKYLCFDGRESFTNMEIKFFCPDCEPI